MTDQAMTKSIDSLLKLNRTVFILTVSLLISLVSFKMDSRLYAQDTQCGFPNALLVVDRSASMNNTLSGQTKWDIATSAIDSMLTQFDQSIHFGLMLYPGPSGSGTGDACRFNYADNVCSPQTPRCTPGEVVVDVGDNQSASIRNALTWPSDLSHAYTPTWQTLEAANQYAPLNQSRVSGQYVILLTDGWQCCGYYNNEMSGIGCEDGANRFLGVEKITEMRQNGITPFVIGFGGSVDVVALQRMAVEAGTLRPGCDPNESDVSSPNLCYYQASNPASLNQFLSDIARQISDEVCDGIDNDCDGQTDEGLVQACSSACGDGQQVCDQGQWGQCSAFEPDLEQCNGIDDDCDGNTDENLTQACSSACGGGQERCEGGTWVDCTAPDVLEETCNGLDDNCNGETDEGCSCLDGERQVCGSNEGQCSTGQQVCMNNQWGPCEGEITSSVEICDGVDNNCDGQIDEGLTRDCSNQCGSGSEQCLNGSWQGCNAPEIPQEVCDGVDNDCDGQADEGSDLCGGSQECRCGGCMDPCTMNECQNGALCIEGYCDVDECPDGYYCQVGTCIEGENPMQQPTLPLDPNSGDSSSMNGNSPSQNAPQNAQPGEGCQMTSSSTLQHSFSILWMILLGLVWRFWLTRSLRS